MSTFDILWVHFSMFRFEFARFSVCWDVCWSNEHLAMKIINIRISDLGRNYICWIWIIGFQWHSQKSVMIVDNQRINWSNQHVHTEIEFVISIKEQRIFNIFLNEPGAGNVSAWWTVLKFISQFFFLLLIKQEDSCRSVSTLSHFQKIGEGVVSSLYEIGFTVDLFEKFLALSGIFCIHIMLYQMNQLKPSYFSDGMTSEKTCSC